MVGPGGRAIIKALLCEPSYRNVILWRDVGRREPDEEVRGVYAERTKHGRGTKEGSSINMNPEYETHMHVKAQ